MANLKDLIVTGPARFLNKIYGNLEGNASTADKWKTARNFSISNRAGVGVAISIDGSSSGGYTLVIPNTISGFNSISTTSLTATGTITAATFSGSLSGNASSATIASYALKMQTYKNGSTTETWGTSYLLYAQWEESILKLKCDNYIVETDAATKLATARTINGTSFDGTVNITTANWGTARTLTIGKTGKSVNGSVNIAWTLSEMGAVNKEGDTMTGALNFANGTWNTMADDAYIGDYNQAGMIGIKGKNGATGIYFAPYSGSTAQTITINGSGTMTISGTVASTFSGNLSGNASTASRLGTATIGSSTKPIYLNAGTPTAFSTTIGNSLTPVYMNAGTITQGETFGNRVYDYNNARIYYYSFGRGQDKNWKKIFAASHSSATPTSDDYRGCTVKGTIYHFTGNFDQAEVLEYPFQVNMTFYAGTSVVNSCILRVAAGCPDTIIRVVRVTTNSFELQVRQPTDWQKIAIQFSYSGNATTQQAFSPVDATNTSVIAFSRLTTSRYISDSNNGADITITYAKAGQSSTSWFASWNGYELGSISTTNARNAMSAMAAINANGFYGMGTPDGNTTDWIRTTSNGIIPYQSGGSSSLGTESWPFNSIYTNNLISYGPVKIGNNANGDTNYIAFYGITGDAPNSYNHTYIGENFYGGSEGSELVLFKGNDIDNNSDGSPGPDRIRHIAARHIFQTYDSPLSGSWTTICDSAVPVTKFEIRPTWIRAHVTTSIGTETSSYALNTASFICDSWIRTKGATGWYNETYGGGLYMADNTWMRVYNDKKLHVSNTDNNSIYTLGGVLAQAGFYNTQNGVSWYVQNNNSSFSHYTTSASAGHWFNKAIYVAGDIYAGTYYNDKVITASHGIQVFSRNDIGTSPNFDNPGVNGFFEVRSTSETPGETGTKPFNGFGAFLNLKTPDAIAMLQLAAISGGELMFRVRQQGNVTMSGAAWKTLLSSSNYTNYTVTKTGGGASGTWSISVNGSAATLDNSSAGTLTWSGDYMLSSSTRPNAKLHFGTDTLYQYRSSNYYIILDSGNYTSYTVTKTGSGASGTWGISITGNAATATKLQTARNIFGRMFDGTGNITGRALFYGSYNSSVNSRFSTAALEIRENGLVDNAQSDIGYAPQIGFHWSNRVAGTLALGSDAKFRFIKQDGSTATLVATLEGYASSAGSSNWSSLLSSYYEDPIPYNRNSFQYFNVYGTAGASVGVNDTPTTQWWHILRCTHNNGNGYYTDVAIPFNDNQIYYKRINAGGLQNGGWVMVYDTKNLVYSSTAPSYPKAGTIWLKPA